MELTRMGRYIWCVVVVCLLILSTSVAAKQVPFDRGLREKLAFLHLRGTNRVQFHMVAYQGCNGELATEVEHLGGTIRFRADKIDYLRVVMPIHSIADVNALLALPALEAATPSLSGQKKYPGARHAVAPAIEGPEPAGPLLTPYKPIADLDWLDWQHRNPTFDGRGVGIAMLDGIPDLLHPNLQRALDLKGRSVPKLMDVQYTGNAVDDLTDTFWVRMSVHITSHGRVFRYGGRTYTTPQDGNFYFALLPRPTMPIYGIQVPVAAVAGGDPSRLPVLWEPRTDTVWVDTNVDGSFADEKPMQPYEKRGDIGVLGRDNPATPLRESVGFTITIDHSAKAVRLNLGWAVHGTEVAGAAVAEGMDGGRFDALAGKSWLGVYETSSVNDSYNVPETLLAAMKNPRIDSAFLESNSYQFDDYTQRDGRDALSIAIDRIIALTHKPIFVPAGNVSGLALINEPSVPARVISVGAYDSAKALRINYVADSQHRDNLHMVGSFGPAGNGALKPDILAPAGHITTDDMNFSDSGRRLPGLIQLPVGYTIGGGTSSAAPTAAAAAALLISAAKQEGIQWDGARLRFALYSTARFLHGIPAYQQGRGLIQIGPAWEALKALNAIKGWEPPQIEVDAPVRTATSYLLANPNHGVGLYEREGWRAHQAGTRDIVFTRRNGPATPVTYQLQWQGDTGAFTSARTLTLPLNIPVKLSVSITTGEPRVYSALLRLRKPGMPVESLSLMATVVAADAPDAATQYTLRRTLDVRRPGVKSLFVYVPPGTTALQASFAKDSPETLRVTYLSPNGDRVDYSTPKLRRGAVQGVIRAPEPGVWELLIDNRAMLRDYYTQGELEPRPSPLTPTRVDVKVKLLRTESEASSPMLASLRNTGAPIAGKVVWNGFGTVFEQPLTLHAGMLQVMDVTVPKGAKLLRAEFGEVKDPTAQITLVAYEMKEGQIVERQKVRGAPGVPLVVRIDDPAPGAWKIVLEPCHLSSDQTTGTYRDLVVRDAHGALRPETLRFNLATDEGWHTVLTSTPFTLPVWPRREWEGVLALGLEPPGKEQWGKKQDATEFEEILVPLQSEREQRSR